MVLTLPDVTDSASLVAAFYAGHRALIGGTQGAQSHGDIVVVVAVRLGEHSRAFGSAGGPCCLDVRHPTSRNYWCHRGRVGGCSTGTNAARFRGRAPDPLKVRDPPHYELQCPPVLALGLMMIFSVTYSA